MLLPIAQVPQHVGEKVRILDEGFPSIEATIIGLDKVYEQIAIPYPVRVEIWFDLLNRPVTVHVHDIELLQPSEIDFEAEYSKGMSIVNKIELMMGILE